MSLLSSLAVAPSTSAPQKTTKWRTLFRSIPSPQRGEENEGFDPPVSNVDFAHSYKSNGNLDTSDIVTCFSGNNQLSETYLDKRAVEEDEKNLIYMKLKEMALNRERLDLSLMGRVEDTAIVNDVNLEKKGIPERQTISEEKLEVLPLTSPDYPSVIAQVLDVFSYPLSVTMISYNEYFCYVLPHLCKFSYFIFFVPVYS